MMLMSFYVAGLVLALVLLVALHRRLSSLPPAVWSLVRKEREAEAPKALDAMKEAVAAKAGASVVAIRQYEEGIAASFRSQVAEADMRARIGERRAEETHAALQAALSLVHELRGALDRMSNPKAVGLPPPPTLPPLKAEDAGRDTKEIALPRIAAGEEDLDDDEMTCVSERPAIVTSPKPPCIPQSSGSGERRVGDRGGTP
jgi:hypothetical protein